MGCKHRATSAVKQILSTHLRLTPAPLCKHIGNIGHGTMSAPQQLPRAKRRAMSWCNPILIQSPTNGSRGKAIVPMALRRMVTTRLVPWFPMAPKHLSCPFLRVAATASGGEEPHGLGRVPVRAKPVLLPRSHGFSTHQVSFMYNPPFQKKRRLVFLWFPSLKPPKRCPQKTTPA